MMKQKKLVIYGTGAQAELAYHYFEKDSEYSVTAFTVQEAYLNKQEHFGRPLIKFENVEQHYSPDETDMFIAVGPIKLNMVLKDICGLAKEKGFKLASYCAPVIKTFFEPEYGENCFFDHGAMFHPSVKLGKGVTLHNSRIGHNSQIGDFSFLSSVILGGNVIVEEHVYLGMGAVIREGVRVGKGSIIGMGCMITKDVEPYSVYSTPGTKAREGMDSRELELFKRR